ncbi:MAG: HD domain-containing protein [Firmicutes bacterium]|nr:HD domain-containing protein [Bacillota bacterium]
MLAWRDMEARLAAALTPQRLRHSYGVAETGVHLALRWGASAEQARVAGLLHDCAKGLDQDKLLQWALAFGILSDDSERVYPDLLHAPVGAVLAWKVYGVTDQAILSAIRLHTQGGENMSILERIIYLADYIEPGRIFPGVEKVRALAYRDLNQAVLTAMEGTMRHVLEQGLVLHPQTVRARNRLLQEVFAKRERGKE